jgi:hypothetical protein
MSSKELDELVKKVDKLKSDEQLFLISYIVNKLQSNYQEPQPHRKWREICGSVPYPLFGEDAQAWVSRTRHEDDEKREKQWSHRK